MENRLFWDIIAEKRSYISKLAATLTDDTTDIKQTVKRQTKLPTLRKIKRAAIPTHKPTQIAAHLILPNRTQSPPTTRQVDY